MDHQIKLIYMKHRPFLTVIRSQTIAWELHFLYIYLRLSIISGEGSPPLIVLEMIIMTDLMMYT